MKLNEVAKMLATVSASGPPAIGRGHMGTFEAYKSLFTDAVTSLTMHGTEDPP